MHSFFFFNHKCILEKKCIRKELDNNSIFLTFLCELSIKHFFLEYEMFSEYFHICFYDWYLKRKKKTEPLWYRFPNPYYEKLSDK